MIKIYPSTVIVLINDSINFRTKFLFFHISIPTEIHNFISSPVRYITTSITPLISKIISSASKRLFIYSIIPSIT